MIEERPSSTYRLQITADFDLDAARELLPYLRDLGVGWVYLSPILQAEEGSGHGYDVTDPTRIDASRGGPEAFTRLAEAAHAIGLGVLVDIVPNHQGVATAQQNPWWWSLLREGRSSPYAAAFDVDWAAGGGRIRIPVLGSTDDLDALTVEGDELVYYDHRLPIAPGTGEGTGREVHDRQHYELVHWQRADADLNYRRFFAVNTLAGVRVEDPAVFDESHTEIKRWFDDGLADGLRVDHPDGLADPGGYLDDLARLTGGAPVWVEKILEPGEVLPPHWATEGTSGYDALAVVDRVLVAPQAEHALDVIDADLAGAPGETWPRLIHGTKRMIADGILRSEVLRLARLIPEVPQADDALAELLACFPVYRSYLPYGQHHLDEAVASARLFRPDLAEPIASVAAVLADPAHPAARRFQQTSGMVMAKGVEDTAFYRFNRLTSLNEVGADPSEFAFGLDRFHAAQAERQASMPHSMTTLSTHDTKRGEDVRARITALAERTELWASAVGELHRLAPIGDGAFENLLWQAVVGAWPASRERLHAYAEKASREAGASTTWTAPDEAFEQRMHAAVDAAFDDERVRAVIERTVAALEPAGRANGLSAKLLQLAGPGFPDVYQGAELWETSLVDPDNRRPVDFATRRELLTRLEDGWLPEVDAEGAAKLLVTSRALRLRREHPERFDRYRALSAVGERAEHLVAFDRGGAIALATRLPATLEQAGGWGGTVVELPGTRLIDAITGTEFSGGVVPVAELLARYPAALLTIAEGADA
ncbi:malto-oligosyltrehalose synthase [Arenivirga flava]|uniref:Malto-oligosyltrehalose synthase n=1 Tax=Arenivirga flava TaxID=1930060 RepID=A0AA37UIX2_9MICO|nr:malto-oligosyltrehalose synthase [Arenivirga flava]GMA27740.1 malto-oligosyltrehalose synthase [Arenivirga flava]